MLHALGLLPFLVGTLALKIDRLSFLQIHGGETLRPVPGDVLFMELRAEAGDPNPVDINLYSIDKGNETVELTTLDPVRNTRVGFEIPSVPPGNFWIRILSSQSKDLLVQSTSFQFYAPGATESSIPPPTLEEAMPTTTVTADGLTTTPFSTSLTVPASNSIIDRPTSTAGSGNPSAPSRNAGIIVGATIGGVGFALLIITLLYFLHRRRTSKANLVAIAPFSMNQPSSGGAASLPLPSPLLKPGMSLSAAQVAAGRAQVLRRERERLDREIAALEGSNRSLTRSSTRPETAGGEAVDRDTDANVRSQLEVLRAQVRRIEATVDPPPGYQ